MRTLLFGPFVLQALFMMFDEFYFHRRRGLPAWERIGHPLDTLALLVCIGYILYIPFSPQALLIYMGLAVFSSVFVTKDEAVHNKKCGAGEQWVHSLLFLLHPVVLICSGLLWPSLTSSFWLRSIFILQFFMVASFLLYQFIYWNFIWKQK